MWNLFERIINALKPSQKPEQPSQGSPQPAEQSEPWNHTSEQQHSPEQTVSTTQQDE